MTTQRLIGGLLVLCLPIGCAQEAETTAACQSAVDAAYNYPASYSDDQIGEVQDQALRDCETVEDFSEGVKRNLGGETSDELAHDVLAAFCAGPLAPSLADAPVCQHLREVDPDAFDRI